jgi:hypothetical protein
MKSKIKDLNFKDPFNAGQMVGMLVMLTFIEKNNGIPQEMLEQLKDVCANNVQVFLEKPTEDIYLMVDKLVSEVSNL